VRLEAQFELAGRGDTAALEATLDDPKLPETARRHALWGLGQVGARQPAALAAVRNHARNAEPAYAELRAQALRVLGDARNTADAELFLEALDAEPARVRYFAAQGLGKLRHAPAASALFAALERNHDADVALRHGLVMGLTGGANLTALRTATHDASSAIRLGALLALRRLGRPEVTEVLQDSEPALVREAAIAINDVPIADGYVALAALLDGPTRDEPVLFRALNAHFRLGRPANANALAAYAARADAPPRARAEALAQLAQWPKPLQRDRLVGVYRPTTSPTRDRAVATSALTPVIPRLFAPGTPAEVLTAALEAMQTLELEGATETLLALLRDESRPAASRVAALQLLDRRQDPRLAEAVRLAGESRDPALRLAALPLATRLAPETAVPVLTALVERGTPAEQKAAFRSLGLSRQEAADDLIASQLRALAAGRIAPEAELELLTAAERRTGPAVKALLAERTVRLAADPDPLAAFHASLAGGDAERGRRVFENQPVLACIRCHRAGGEGGDAGPNLAGLGTRASRRELLESILKPNAKISPGYDTVVVTLRNGGTAAGIVAEETADQLTLRNPENQLVKVAKADIARRDGAPSGMPEVYATLLSPTELRDVVEYLASLRGESRPATNVPRALRGPPPLTRAE
jgi:quinoprotein glucose dehydrogenase